MTPTIPRHDLDRDGKPADLEANLTPCLFCGKPTPIETICHTPAPERTFCPEHRRLHGEWLDAQLHVLVADCAARANAKNAA